MRESGTPAAADLNAAIKSAKLQLIKSRELRPLNGAQPRDWRHHSMRKGFVSDRARGDSDITYMIDTVLTTEFAIATDGAR